MQGYTAVVAGATGLVGEHLVDQLESDQECKEVILVSRRTAGRGNPKIREIIADPDNWSDLEEDWRGARMFCCLGTTMKKAGSKEAFRKVDHDAVLDFAERGLLNGAKSFVLVSSVGASTDSAFFYSRVKGEVENKLRTLKYVSTLILRPSMILGDRNEFRFGEAMGKGIMKILSPLMLGKLRRYRGVHAATIARAMIGEEKKQSEGVKILESEQIATYST